jgi:hypothetical protein
MTKDELAAKPERDPLCMAMIAAWLNVTVEQLPVLYRVHTCEQSMAAWQRVADAARQNILAALENNHDQ